MIFISIASYTDPELPRTLRDCLDNARWPADLRFGICWQGDPADPVPLNVFRSDKRFRYADYTIAESEGGTWARSIAQRFWEGETHTLQIDSHMKFDENWDVRLIEMHVFLGLTLEEVAQVRERSLSTVKREWRRARAWLSTSL